MKVGEMIRAKRVEKEMSQMQLAEKLGWGTSQYVSNIERNASNPPFKSVVKLCRILGLKPGEVYSMMLDADMLRLRDKYAGFTG